LCVFNIATEFAPLHCEKALRIIFPFPPFTHIHNDFVFTSARSELHRYPRLSFSLITHDLLTSTNTFTMRTAAIAGALFAAIAAASDVHDLKKDTFEDFVKENDLVLAECTYLALSLRKALLTRFT
jgi:hypothetical protein